MNTLPELVKKEIAVASFRERIMVVFHLEEQMYAIPIPIIIQILEMVTITPVPQMNPAVKGVINVRGEVVPVISLRRYLGLAELPPALDTPLILVQVTKANASATPQKLALLVDEVIDVMRTVDQDVISIPDLLPEALQHTPMVQGVLQTQQGMVVLLDLHHLFAADAALSALPLKVPLSAPQDNHLGGQQ